MGEYRYCANDTTNHPFQEGVRSVNFAPREITQDSNSAFRLSKWSDTKLFESVFRQTFLEKLQSHWLKKRRSATKILTYYFHETPG